MRSVRGEVGPGQASARRPVATTVVASVVLAAAGCGAAGESAGQAFEDATDAWGLDVVHDVGTRRTYFLPELMGPGVALLDHDGDGDLDAYVVNAWPAPGGGPPSSPNRLFRQGPDGTFADVTAASGLGDMGYGMGVAVGDYDNDADLDVYVTNYGPNALYRNRGDGTFEDVTAGAGVGDPAWSTSAAFLDYDADGWLDLYVAAYLDFDPDLACPDATGRRDYCPPGQFRGVPDTLYRNRGDGTFEDVSGTSGIGTVEGKPGLGVAVADFTDDGRIDVFVANDQQANHLWVNQGDGTFREEGVLRGVAFDQAGMAQASMGIACADLDGDLELDLFLTHLRGESNTAYRRVEGGMFADDTMAMGLYDPSIRFTGFGAVAIDVEHDGDLDLATTNGHVYRGPREPGADPASFWSDYAQPGQLYRNDGRGEFTDASASAGEFGRIPEVGRGLAAGDVDGDGDLDLLAGNCGARARLHRNVADKAGRWLSVRAWDGQLQRDAIGALVGVRAGERRFLRVVSPAQSYLSSGDVRTHFGLGDVDWVDEIVILWPDGVPERFEGGPPDRHVLLVRGFGTREGVPP
jgi:hypothetical protein